MYPLLTFLRKIVKNYHSIIVKYPSQLKASNGTYPERNDLNDDEIFTSCDSTINHRQIRYIYKYFFL